MKLLSLLSLLALLSCGPEPGNVETPPGKPVAVAAAAVSAREWPTVYEATGSVRARTTAVISSKVMGHIRQVLVDAGQRVHAGQPLVILDSRELETSVIRAEAAALEIRGAIPEADNSVAAAKANLDLAEATFRRMEDLAAKKSISNQEFDEAMARRKSAQANFEIARSRSRQLDSKAAQVDQEVRAAGIARDHAKITAPFPGVVVSRSAEPGALATPGAPLLTLEQEGVYRFEVAIDESRLASVARGQIVEVTLEAIDATVKARVSEVAPYVDPASRSYVAKLDLPPVPALRSGMFGRAAFPTGSEHRLALDPALGLDRTRPTAIGVCHRRRCRPRSPGDYGTPCDG
jgi:RND family efflux transporter MFP subunit